MKCGLLGRKLGHSYSPQIHAALADYSYGLFEKEPEELGSFLENGDFSGLNVTIPDKKAVIPYLSELSPTAARLGAVNTVVRRSDGSLMGHNTDYFGFRSMVEKCGLSPAGKKALVLGSGGASNVGVSPVDLSKFPHLEGVLDVVYNPARTQLLLDAEARGLVAMNGLWMLVAQAKESAEWFTGSAIPDDRIAAIHRALKAQMENIILIGMPGSGKSTVGGLLAARLGRELVDADAEIVRAAGKSIPAKAAKRASGPSRLRCSRSWASARASSSPPAAAA